VALRTAPKKPLSLKAVAVRLLARREYARAELTERLIARGAARAEVEQVLDELERNGYLSDARFAQAVVAQRAGRFGKRAIAHELREKKVDPAAAQDAMAALANTDELGEATALWQRRFGNAPKDEREKARQVRFLLSRGYSLTIALNVLRAAGTAADRD
jgi:regulatory protein